MKAIEIGVSAFSSIFTAVAAVVALYFGVEAQRSRINQDLERMRLTAAHCRPRLKALSDALTEYAQFHFRYPKPSLNTFFEHQTRLMWQLEQTEYRCTDEELLRMVPLEREAANRLASILGEVSAVCTAIRRAKENSDFGPLGSTHLVQTWHVALVNASVEVAMLATFIAVAANGGDMKIPPRSDRKFEDFFGRQGPV